MKILSIKDYSGKLRASVQMSGKVRIFGRNSKGAAAARQNVDKVRTG